MNLYCDNPNDVALSNYQLAVDNSSIIDATVALTVCEKTPGGTITAATNASPIVVTSAGHGLANGDQIYVNAVEGNRAANGLFEVANVTADTFELVGSTGSGSYLTGGKWYSPVDGAAGVNLTYNSGRKEYRGTLSEDIPLIATSQYIGFVDTSYNDHWEIQIQAIVRQA